MQTVKEDVKQEGEGLSYRDRLPLRWVELAALPAGLEAERLAEANARLLTSVALLEEHLKPSDEPSATELELQRIHHKLNLLLELVGGFLNAQSPRPESVSLRLSWRGVQWEGSGELPTIGAVGLIEIHPSRMLPQALRWPARIVAVSTTGAIADFDTVPDFCQAALERHVFQHHRREIAEARQPIRQVP
ncbi:MAG: PilZ domain-containing protein [Nevskiales bacterium]